jgi:hypothetical protein
LEQIPISIYSISLPPYNIFLAEEKFSPDIIAGSHTPNDVEGKHQALHHHWKETSQQAPSQ